ncbi:MAG: hypothetical protein JWN29_3727 [Acidimicrobiales bacterium]|nr:hypothetical protein [Acidimicrobiales bacterium]
MPLALPIWTLLIWTTRIRNIVAGDWSVTDLILPIGLTILAVVALVDRRRGVPALAAATVAVWAIRLPLVLVHDHGAAFKLVHTALALVSFGLAYASWRAVSRRPLVATRG